MDTEEKILKCAFVVICKGVTPRNYVAVHKNPECQCLVVGVDNEQMGIQYIRKLMELGYTVINLSGKFDDRTAEMLQREAGSGFKIRNARYTIDDIMDMQQIYLLRNYGIIIKLPGVEKPQESVMRSKRCDTRVIFVKDIRQARNAGKRMIQKRVQLVELSTWFDRLRMYKVQEAMEHSVPIGTCGDLDMIDLEP